MGYHGGYHGGYGTVVRRPIDVLPGRFRLRFDVLDGDLNPIGELYPAVSGQVRVDLDRKVARTLEGIVLDDPDINLHRDRIRPVWTDGSGTWPLGVFVWASVGWKSAAGRRVLDGGVAFDQTCLLDVESPSTLTAARGENVASALQRMLRAAGFVTVLPDTDVTLAETLVWPAGTTHLEACGPLLELAGWRLWFDRHGALQVGPPPEPGLQAPDFVYDDGPSSPVVDGTVEEAEDLLGRPNVWYVHPQDPTSQFVGRFELPPSAPGSVKDRGFEVPRVYDVPAVRSQAEADRLARRRAAADLQVVTVTLETRPLPAHDLWQVVRWRGVDFVESQVTVRFDGGPHSRVWRRIVTVEDML